MKAVITADVINSTKWPTNYWIDDLKEVLQQYGNQGEDWEIYRGDEVQLLLQNPDLAFLAAIKIKLQLKRKSLDARVSIGLGNVDFKGDNIKENNGSAFVNSGRNLEEMKKSKSQSLSIKSDNSDFDENFNLKFLLLEATFEKWTENSANTLSHYFGNIELNQQEISEQLGITQGALSRSLKRANLDAITEIDSYFQKKINEL